MARFVASTLIADVRGSLGGLTFKMSRYGPVLYPRTYRPPRARQETRDFRQDFSYLADLWHNTLTIAQRNAWNRHSAPSPWSRHLARPQTLSGYQCYIQHNLLRQRIAIPLFTLPPADHSRAPIPWQTIISQAPNKVPISWSNPPIAADQDAIVTISWPFYDSQVHPRVWARQTYHTHGPKVGWETYRIDPPYLRPSWVEVRATLLDDNHLNSLPYVYHLWCPA